MPPTKLDAYRKKRDFRRTSEPAGHAGGGRGGEGPIFCVQKHAATQLHYDLRLEIGGTLKSWAVTRGPSLDPKVKRLAVHVEDHPLDYASFEGIIPKGEYGGGEVIVWDHGHWVPMGDPESDLAAGQIKFRLAGTKLNGGWTLVQLKSGRDADGKNWLLIKERDIYARTDAEIDVVEEFPLSAKTGRAIEELRIQSRESKKPKKPTRLAPSRIKGAKKALLPEQTRPQLATSVDLPPNGDDWLHEMKLDGYRTLARIDGDDIRLFTRNGHDWTERYQTIADAFSEVGAKSALIDGEIVVQDGQGKTSFPALQDALATGAMEKLVFFAFDLLYLNGYDLRQVPLKNRKATLSRLLDPHLSDVGPIQVSEHVVGNGPAFFAEAARLSLEGVISKRADASYVEGRTKSWQKSKCLLGGDFLIVGYTVTAAAGGLAALSLAEQTADGLAYVGKVGTGWSAEVAADLRSQLEPLRRKTAPFKRPKGLKAGDAIWVRPEYLAEIQYTARTSENALRHAVFQGLRPDKSPAESNAIVTRERLVTDQHLAQIWITNPDREMLEPGGPSKLDIVLHYAKVGDWMLPEIIDRPLTLIRCPTGKIKDCFYQRHRSEGMPADIKGIEVHEEGEPERREFVYVDGANGLLQLAQFGVVEVHPWGARIDKLDRPDRIIFDLDPDESLDWRDVVAATLDVRESLTDLGLEGFVRTTGGKGLHIVVPIARRQGWPAVKEWTRRFVVAMAQQSPRRYTANPQKGQRRGRIYIDYLRNTHGATAVGSFSLRARPGVPVATPITWDELRRLDDPAEFNWRTVPERLASLNHDPWAGFEKAAKALPKLPDKK